MDEATLKEWLEPVTHRPGWEIKFAGRLTQGFYIVIWATEQDTNNPDSAERFTAGPLFRVPDDISTAAELYDWILDVCIPGIDTHERMEWFRVAGEKWRDPHAPQMPAFATDFPSGRC